MPPALLRSSAATRARAPIVAWALAISAAGCLGPVDEDRTAEAQAAIAGGEPAPGELAVVGIVANDGVGVGLCSGSLIAANAVLTARHCVSPTMDEVLGGVSCSQTTSGPAYAADGFRVTTGEVAFLAAEYVREVLLPPGDAPLLCGNDIAILVLHEPFNPSEVRPLVPRVDSPIGAGDVYAAIGFGATNDDGDEAGVRRRLENLIVDCVGEGCDSVVVTGTEWRGDRGVCQGDSGGPALDEQGRVVGITSRGAKECEDPIYGHVFAWSDWIKEATNYAADTGGVEPPAWTSGYPTDSKFWANVGTTCDDGADCESGQCVRDSQGSYCTRACTPEAYCPDGYSCVGGEFVCRKDPPPEAADEGCRAAPVAPSPGTGALVACVLAIGLAGLRRRRSLPR